MQNYILMKTQKNSVFQILEGRGFDLIEFDWEETVFIGKTSFEDEAKISRLVHKPSSSYFEFDMRNDYNISFKYSPGEKSTTYRDGCLSFDDILDHVKKWSAYLRREIDAPDLWAMVYERKSILEAFDTDSNQSPFSSEEKEDIKLLLKDLKIHISANIISSQEQIDALDKKIDYLSEAVDRMSKTDWMHTFIGVFFTLMTALALAPDQVRMFFDYISNSFVIVKDKLIGRSP